MGKLRLMSQNQWNLTNNIPSWEEIGLDASSEVRMKGHCRVFKELLPDIVGGQEVNKDMQLDLKLNLMEAGLPYTLIWGNYNPIIYRSDKFELLDNEYIIYPEEIDGFDGEFNDVKSKAANLAVFREKEDGNVFIFVTTHLWWMNGRDPDCGWYRKGSDHARRLQIEIALDLIDKYQAKYNNCPVFFVGDMNTDYNSDAIQYALKERGYSHAHDVATEYADPENGYNNCGIGGRTYGEWEHLPFEAAIDHILVRDFSNLNILRFDRYTPDYYVYLSDHAPVYVDIEFK